MPTITGTSGSDTLTGTDQADTLYGGGGDDILNGGGGNDILYGGNLLGGGAGATTDTLNGGAGDDVAIWTMDTWITTFDGADGFDTADYSAYNQLAFFFSQPLTFQVGANGEVEASAFIFQRGQAGYNQVIGTFTNVERFITTVYGTVNLGTYTRGLTIDGSAQIDRITTGSGRDTIHAGSGADIVSSGAGDDVLDGGGGSDQLNGGDGVDTAVYSGVRRQYAASHAAVADGPEGGTDTLVSIENTRFLDGSITYDENSVAAEILRIYDATLDRGPDAFGLDGWLQARSGGTTLVQMANSFVNSDEFKARYGALNDDGFVSLLYQFCLNRNVDAFGLKSYTDLLKSGAWSRGDVVLSLSESVEHRQLMAPQLDQGLWVADQTTLTIARLYDATFDRLPDLFGLNAWRQEIAAGRTLNSMAAAFASSVEFQNRYGALSNSDFVKLIYTYSLDRNVDPLGLKSYTDLLDSGQWSRADVLLSLSESAEHKQLTAPLWYNGVQYQGYVAPAADVAETASKAQADAFVMPALYLSGLNTDVAIDSHVIDASYAFKTLNNYDSSHLVAFSRAGNVALTSLGVDGSGKAFVLPAWNSDVRADAAEGQLGNVDNVLIPGDGEIEAAALEGVQSALPRLDELHLLDLDGQHAWVLKGDYHMWA